MPENRLWSLTSREYHALEAVYKSNLMRWAIERSMYANVHFLERDSSGRPIGAAFTPEDFLGTGDREGRRRTISEKMEVAFANQALATIPKGEPTDDIPEWARGEYKGGK